MSDSYATNTCQYCLPILSTSVEYGVRRSTALGASLIVRTRRMSAIDRETSVSMYYAFRNCLSCKQFSHDGRIKVMVGCLPNSENSLVQEQ